MAKADTKTTEKTAKPAKKVTAKKEKASNLVGIVEINAIQYIVREGETIAARISPTTKEADIKLLGLIENNVLNYGKPYLTNKMNFEVLEAVKGEKVRTSIFKAKSRYRKTRGFRPQYVEIKFNSFGK